ncbi:MAG: hypothetical protein GKS06_11470 [Acidobacteria bacterium]|nr:hypothetical protein [Acidobacteriota bacterium]
MKSSSRWTLPAAVLCIALALPATSQEVDSKGTNVVLVSDDLNDPVAFDFLGAGDVLVLERSGRLLRVRDGASDRVVARLRVATEGSRGGLGLAVSPNFTDDGHVFVHYSSQRGGRWRDNRVVRLRLSGKRLRQPRRIASFPVGAVAAAAGNELNGGPLRFGSDGMLYGLVGSLGLGAARTEQNIDDGSSSGSGALFRLSPDGMVPDDNPFSSSDDETLRRWFAFGLRDGNGLAIDGLTGTPWLLDQGPGQYDELNSAAPGMNGGWVLIVGPDDRDARYSENGNAASEASDLPVVPGAEYGDPALSWKKAPGVSGLSFLGTDAYGPKLRDRLVAGSAAGDIYLLELPPRAAQRDRLRLAGALADRVVDKAAEARSVHWGNGFGPIRDMRIGPDGLLYVLSADGRLLRVETDAAPAARYEVTFDATWSAATHPADYPSSAHFSGLVGGTHSSAATFWARDEIASTGIKEMAEFGAKGSLLGEVRDAIDLGTARSTLSGGAIGVSPGRVALEFDIDPGAPFVTLVSMIAPSPDWFVGVSGLSLWSAATGLTNSSCRCSRTTRAPTAAQRSRPRIPRRCPGQRSSALMGSRS